MLCTKTGLQHPTRFLSRSLRLHRSALCLLKWVVESDLRLGESSLQAPPSIKQSLSRGGKIRRLLFIIFARCSVVRFFNEPCPLFLVTFMVSERAACPRGIFVPRLPAVGSMRVSG
ncbi:hypothetical protein ElyMa_001401000 [Elysia marginata]|uniref:Uncharacterized protein n=1 Tax=Elysia marginata TaxID=1093978 RepID=A0AAV4ITS9_9GAST|nr:hypothetical protein ElyMa_001401000 [Elysia marginata]